MKKLLTFVSAITAGAIGTAAADVSVSGAGNFYFSSASGDKNVTTQDDTMSVAGGSVDFAMSTVTNGVTVTMSASLTQDTDDATTVDAEDSAAAGGMSSLTFDNGSLKVSLGKLDNAGSGTGEGGDVSNFASTHASVHAASTGVASASDSSIDGIADGNGISISTSMGAASIDATFVSSVGSGTNSYRTNATTTGYASGYSLNVGFDLAGAAVNVAAGGSQAKVTSAKNNTGMALEVSYPVSDALSLTVGGSNGTIAGADEDNVFITAAYTMDADTTLKIGVAEGDSTLAGSLDKATATTINVTRALGGGVSVFAEYADISNSDAGVDSSASAVSVGTSVSF